MANTDPDESNNERQPLLTRNSSSSTLLSPDTEAAHSKSDPHPPILSSGAAATTADDDDDPTTPQKAPTGRTLTWSSAYILTLSRIVGSGIFATPGPIYTSLHSIPLTLLVWLIGATLAFCGLAISLELGCMLPRSGGTKVYLEYMYRRPRFLASTMVAVQAVVLGFTASNCIVFGEYVLSAFGFEGSKWAVRGLAVALLTGITVLHGVWLKGGIAVQNALGWVKIALMGFMALLGFVALFLPHHRATTQQNLSAHFGANRGFWEGANWDLVAISTAIFKVSYSFAGYDNVNNVLNEVKNPVRTLKTMAPAALLTVTLFYLMVNIAYFIVVPLEEIEGSGELIAALFFQKLFGVSIGSKVLSILVAISAAGNVMVVTFSVVSPPPHPLPFPNFPPNLPPASPHRILHPTGPPKPRNRPLRLPPLPTHPLLLQTIQRTPWRPNRALHPLPPRHRATPAKGRLRFHPRCGRFSGPVLRPGDLCGDVVVAQAGARVEATV